MDEIIVKHGVKKRIKTNLGTSYPAIRLALLGATDTELAQKIRKHALYLGGVKIEKSCT